MAVYHFTVRATDSAGAFSDRTFAIQVNNTLMDRFVVVGTAGLARSPNGEDGSWVYEPGLSGNAVVHGNGRWIVYNTNSKTIHTSPDAVNWSTYTLDVDGLTFTGISRIKFVGDKWIAFTRGATETRCLTSTDGLNWTLATTIVPPSQTYSYSEVTVPDFEYADGVYVASMSAKVYTGANARHTRNIFYSTDMENWQVGYSYTTGATPRLPRYGQIVRNINGMWLTNICSNATAGALQISSDGVIWTGRELPATYCYGLTYYNGRLFTLSAATPYLYVSEDAGRTWTQLGSGFATVNYDEVTGAVQMSSILGVYANRMIVAYNRGTVSTIYKSTDDGATWTTESLDSTKIGSVNAVGVRV